MFSIITDCKVWAIAIAMFPGFIRAEAHLNDSMPTTNQRAVAAPKKCLATIDCAPSFSPNPPPVEIGAFLTSPQYIQTIQALRAPLQNQGADIVVSPPALEQIGGTTFVTASLQKRSLQTGEVSRYGTITSQINYGPNGQFSLDGMWFTPAAQPPANP